MSSYASICFPPNLDKNITNRRVYFSCQCSLLCEGLAALFKCFCYIQEQKLCKNLSEIINCIRESDWMDWGLNIVLLISNKADDKNQWLGMFQGWQLYFWALSIPTWSSSLADSLLSTETILSNKSISKEPGTSMPIQGEKPYQRPFMICMHFRPACLSLNFTMTTPSGWFSYTCSYTV